MNKKKVARSALYLSLTFALAACGGGSGGGSSDDRGPGGSLGLDTGGYSDRKASIGALGDFDAALQLYADASDASDLIWEVEDSLLIWDAPVQNGNVYTQACDNEGGTVVVTDNGENANDDESWQFTNCEVATESYGRVLLNGTYRYVDTLTAETAVSDTWEGYEAFSISGSFLDSNEALNLQGREDWIENYEEDGYEVTYRIDSLEFVRGALYIALSNATFRSAEDAGGGSVSLNVNVIGSAINGYVTLSTPTSITTSSDAGCPSFGVLRIEGEGYGEVRYGSSAGTGDAAVVEVNGSRTKAIATCAEIGRYI